VKETVIDPEDINVVGDEADEDVEAMETAEAEETSYSDDGEEDYDAEDDAPTGPPPGMSVALSPRDQAVIDAIQRASGGPPKVRYSQFRTRSSFNPKGRKREMGCIVYQNGYRLPIKMLNDVEISLLKRLKPGVFINKIVRVRKDTGVGEEEDKIYISDNNKTPDQRMTFRNHVQNFAHLVKQCVDEAEAAKQRRAARNRQ
jgi:hypothetical protein